MFVLEFGCNRTALIDQLEVISNGCSFPVNISLSLSCASRKARVGLSYSFLHCHSGTSRRMCHMFMSAQHARTHGSTFPASSSSSPLPRSYSCCVTSFSSRCAPALSLSLLRSVRSQPLSFQPVCHNSPPNHCR